jgi:RNA polymerase sigma-32 factor
MAKKKPLVKSKVPAAGKTNAKSDAQSKIVGQLKSEPVKKAKSVVAELVDPLEPSLHPEAPPLESESTVNFQLIEPETTPSALPGPQGKVSRSPATTDPLQTYLAEIKKYPLLSREQEQELAKRYFETKDPAAAQALVTANLRFVVKVAAEYSKFGARLIDLVQEGNMGLMHAVRDFNPYKGVRLITYAVWWIRGYIQEYLMKQHSLVKIGTTHNQKKLFYQLQKQKRELEALGASPNVKLIAEKLGLPEDEVAEMSQRMSGRDVSLDAPLDFESSSSLKDFRQSSGLSPDEQLSQAEELNQLKKKIEILRQSLNDREKILLDERLLADDPLTLQEIGEKYGITREAVRQAETRLMKKLKDLYPELLKKDS